MRKIKYPSDRTDLESDYWNIFKDFGLQAEWVRLRNLFIGWSDSPDKEAIYPVQIRDVVCGKYDKLVDIYLDYKAIKKKKRGDSEFENLETDLFSLFSYSQCENVYSRVFQPLIAEFFMRHAAELELHVCHYCETAYVNAYGFSDVFRDFGCFLKNATKEDIRHYIRKENGGYLSKETIKKIHDLQEIFTEDQIIEEFDKMKQWRGRKKKKSKTVFDKLRNHFDLDHFLPKSKCPIVGLSLYNFVPCCAVCNEKLKGADELGCNEYGADDRAKWLMLSPTSDLYSFENDVTIKIDPLPSEIKIIKDADDYQLSFSPSNSKYEPVIREFMLEERYNYHKNEALRLHDLLVDYPKSRIKMLKSVFGGSKTERDIENDIFGVEYRQQYHRCFSKMYSDIFHTHYKK